MKYRLACMICRGSVPGTLVDKQSAVWGPGPTLWTNPSWAVVRSRGSSEPHRCHVCTPMASVGLIKRFRRSHFHFLGKTVHHTYMSLKGILRSQESPVGCSSYHLLRVSVGPPHSFGETHKCWNPWVPNMRIIRTDCIVVRPVVLKCLSWGPTF